MSDKQPSRIIIGSSVVLTVIFSAILLVFVNYLSWRHYKTFDLTENKMFTLSDKTVNLLKGLDHPVKLYFFFNPEHGLYSWVDKLLRQYREKGGDKIEFEVVDPQRDLVRAQELAKRYRFTGEDNMVIVESGERHKFIEAQSMAEMDMSGMMTGQPARIKAFRGEEKITSALLEVVEGESRKVYFTLGHGEGDITSQDPKSGYFEAAEKLKRINISPMTLNLVQKPEIPADAAALVIAGPLSPFQPDEIKVIEDYLKNRKGKLFIALHPGAKSALDDLLAQYGIRADDTMALGAVNLLGVTKLLGSVPAGMLGKHPITDPILGQSLVFTNARSLTVLPPAEGQKGRPVELAKGIEAFWGETAYDKDNMEFTEGKDLQGPLTLAVAVDTGTVGDGNVELGGTRIVVSGSATMFANAPMMQYPMSPDFFMNSVSWILRNEKQLGIEPKVPKQYSLGLSPSQFWMLGGVICLLLPASILLGGVAVWLKRRG